jgi:hypothetical protein
VNCI